MAEYPILEVDGLSKRFVAPNGTSTEAIGNIGFSVREGEFLVILGPTGCGKTTLLRCLSGLVAPDAGTVVHKGRPVAGVPSWLAIVFQEYNKSLFPWLTVEKNVRFPLRSLSRAEAHSQAVDALGKVGLTEFGDHYPWQLSGGMQQRVAIARAIATNPELLVMDEPFASVDALTRIKLEDMLLELWSELRFSAVFVTHDIEEAIYLGDRVLTLSGRPSRVLADFAVDLPRPRTQLETKALPVFQELRSRAFKLVERAGRNSKIGQTGEPPETAASAGGADNPGPLAGSQPRRV